MKFDPQKPDDEAQNKHHRRSIRLNGYDYSQAGAYFVTIVAWQREMLFGEIVGGEMQLNDFGEIVRDEWERTEIVRPNVELGEYIVMPNHVHGILIFIDDHVGATRRVAPTKTTLQPNSLGAVIGQFKSIVTKRINGLWNVSGRPVWQRNYYEHIIRNDREMDNIHRYIESNPSMWADDDENPNNIHDV
ncbi:MAG TPA: transposase [Anaerolineae bacterium]|nr:transposase [Anaerolineae bacterium]